MKIKALSFVLTGCSFYETQTQEALDADYRPVWFITLGQSGTTDVRMEDCTVRAEEVSGNTIRGRIRHKVFQDCSGVENNKVEVRRFSILG